MSTSLPSRLQSPHQCKLTQCTLELIPFWLRVRLRNQARVNGIGVLHDDHSRIKQHYSSPTPSFQHTLLCGPELRSALRLGRVHSSRPSPERSRQSTACCMYLQTLPRTFPCRARLKHRSNPSRREVEAITIPLASFARCSDFLHDHMFQNAFCPSCIVGTCSSESMFADTSSNASRWTASRASSLADESSWSNSRSTNECR